MTRIRKEFFRLKDDIFQLLLLTRKCTNFKFHCSMTCQNISQGGHCGSLWLQDSGLLLLTDQLLGQSSWDCFFVGDPVFVFCRFHPGKPVSSTTHGIALIFAFTCFCCDVILGVVLKEGIAYFILCAILPFPSYVMFSGQLVCSSSWKEHFFLVHWSTILSHST